MPSPAETQSATEGSTLRHDHAAQGESQQELVIPVVPPSIFISSTSGAHELPSSGTDNAVVPDEFNPSSSTNVNTTVPAPAPSPTSAHSVTTSAAVRMKNMEADEQLGSPSAASQHDDQEPPPSFSSIAGTSNMNLTIRDHKSAALSDDLYSSPSVAGDDYQTLPPSEPGYRSAPGPSTIGGSVGGPSSPGPGSVIGSHTSAPNAQGEMPPPYSIPNLQDPASQKPGARLNIAMLVVGGLDDVHQLSSIGVLLRNDHGHRVRVATHPEFKSLVQGCGLEFFSLGEADDYTLSRTSTNQSTQSGGSGSLKKTPGKGWKMSLPDVLGKCWRACIEGGDNGKPFVADAIVANPQSFAHVHCAEKLGVPVHIVSKQPWTATKMFPHPLAATPITDGDAGTSNLTSYAAVEVMVWRETGETINKFRKATLNLEQMNLTFAPGLLQRLGVPATYFTSETLRERPDDWPEQITLASGLEEGASMVHKRLMSMSRPCPIVPDAVATLQIKKNAKFPMSPAAAALLVKVGALRLQEIEPFHSQTWNVVRIPTDPITGLASATHDTVLEMAQGLAAGPREAYKQMKRTESSNSNGRSGSGGVANGVEAVAVSTTKGVGTIIGAGFKSPIVLTDGITRGFHNAPRLYGDETVRDEYKVTGWKSGFSAAGKEFGHGVFDGITGIFTQPVDGARKEGAVGFLKGCGKGLGGAIFKPAAGAVGVTSHSAMGLYKEFQKIGKPDLVAKIVAGRLARGEEDYEQINQGERSVLVEKYRQLSEKKD